MPYRQGSQPRSVAQVAGMGLELAGTTVALAGLGHLVDRYCGGAGSIGFAAGGFIGFGLGMYRFILKALKQIEETND
jgi:F0F1-type ATP synthase assembly protein I